MDLIAWIEAHLTLLGAVATVIVSAAALWRAADHRSTTLEGGLRVLEGKLDAHSQATEAGFRGMNRRLDALNGKVFLHEREIGELRGHVGRLEADG